MRGCHGRQEGTVLFHISAGGKSALDGFDTGKVSRNHSSNLLSGFTKERGVRLGCRLYEAIGEYKERFCEESELGKEPACSDGAE